MRALGISSAAAALCVCCVLPSFDAVDRLPGDGSGGDSAAAGSASSMAGSNTTEPSGGKNSTAGSGTGTEGGDPGTGDAGSGGSEPMAGSGGNAGAGGSSMGGSSMGGSSMGGSSMGGVSGSGGANGGGGAGGSMSGKPECSKFCDGENGLVVRCQGYLEPVVASEAGCKGVCNDAPASSLACWQTHLDNVITGLSAAVHCNHASGKAGNGVCPERSAP